LVCTTPTTVPTIIVAAAIQVTTIVHSAAIGASAVRNTRTIPAIAAALIPVDMNPVTIAGAPW
jgi:hypothetical protein